MEKAFIFLLYVIWALAAFGFLALVAGLAVAVVWNLARRRYLAALGCLLGVLACPAYHYYDVYRGEALGAPWRDLKLVRRPDASEPTVVVLRDARYCGPICREALARGAVDRVTLAKEIPPGSGRTGDIFMHRLVDDGRCAGDSQPDRPIQPVEDRNRAPCIIGTRTSLPTQSYTRITFDTVAYPRVRDAGFPVLSSNNFSGTYFLMVESVMAGRVELLAQSFRQVRQPMPLFYGLQYLAPESATLRQTVGARIDQYEALNQIMGWSLKGRLPAYDPKPVPPGVAPGTPTILVCDEKAVPVRCEFKPAPKS